MKQHRVLGANREQVNEIYEETVLSTLGPRIVLNIACAREKTCILLADGNVYDFPKTALPRLVSFPPRAQGRIEQLQAGDTHFVALTDHLVWNVYTWGSTNAEGQLGRDVINDGEDDDSIKQPGVVKQLPGRVVKVTCGANFTLCQSSTGELWGFGDKDCLYGQVSNKSSSTSSSSALESSAVVKIHWGSTGTVNTSSRTTTTTTNVSSQGNNGLVWRWNASKSKDDDLVSSLPSLSSSQIHGDDQDNRSRLLFDVLTASPGDDQNVESLIIGKYAEQAWSKTLKFAEAEKVSRQRELEARDRLKTLRTRVAQQEQRTEHYARTMLSFAEGSNRIPPSLSVDEHIVEGQEEEDSGSTRSTPSETVDKASMSSKIHQHKVISKAIKKHPSRIRDKMLEDLVTEMETRKKDSVVCMQQLDDSVSMLQILRDETKQMRVQVDELSRQVLDSEISAKDWRTRALMFDRAMLRLKRQARTRAGFTEKRGLARVFPTAAWTRDLTTTNRRFVVDEEENKVWVLGRMDPDWGLRLSLASIKAVVTTTSSSSKFTHLYLAPNQPGISPQQASGGGEIVIPVRMRPGGVFELQSHAVFQVKQIGEDTTFWIGFGGFASKDDLKRFSVEELSVEIHGDQQVAERIMDQVKEQGNFLKQDQHLWEGMRLELIGTMSAGGGRW